MSLCWCLCNPHSVCSLDGHSGPVLHQEFYPHDLHSNMFVLCFLVGENIVARRGKQVLSGALLMAGPPLSLRFSDLLPAAQSKASSLVLTLHPRSFVLQP